MTFDRNIEILSFENANIKKARLVQESIEKLTSLLSLDISYNQINRIQIIFLRNR